MCEMCIMPHHMYNYLSVGRLPNINIEFEKRTFVVFQRTHCRYALAEHSFL